MWAILAAPLIIGSDPRALSAASISMLENPQVLAVDQDSLGLQGTLVAQSGSAQVWVKPLWGGARAVALLNRGTSPVRITTTALAVGLPKGPRYLLQNLWSNQTTTTQSTISAIVPGHGVVLYRTAVTSAPPKPRKHTAKDRSKRIRRAHRADRRAAASHTRAKQRRR
jgi:alpha-galactosidase